MRDYVGIQFHYVFSIRPGIIDGVVFSHLCVLLSFPVAGQFLLSIVLIAWFYVTCRSRWIGWGSVGWVVEPLIGSVLYTNEFFDSGRNLVRHYADLKKVLRKGVLREIQF